MNSENIIIDDRDIETAQEMCKAVNDRETRNRIVSDTIAISTAEKYFKEDNLDIDTSTGIYKIEQISEDIDIADFYINDAYIDCRFYFENELPKVPIQNLKDGLIPAAYMFIKISADYSNALVTGFTLPNKIDYEQCSGNYYELNEDELLSFYDIEPFILKPEEPEYDDRIFYDYLDGQLSSLTNFYHILLTSKYARTKLAKIINAQNIFNFVSKAEAITETPQYDVVQDAEYDELVNTESDDQNFLEELSDISEADNTVNEYTTAVTPSLQEIEESSINEGIQESAIPLETASILEEETVVDTTEEKENNIEDNFIENLFQDDMQGEPTQDINETNMTIKKNKGISPLLIILLLLIIGAGGYFGYTKYTQNQENNAIPETPVTNNIDNVSNTPVEKKQEAMPIENVDNKKPSSKSEEGNAIAIPAIEQHLDASVLVSNLKVDWEVPSGYAANTSAKRYLIKLGKIIQLNLKTELLLLNKPPISNKIAVEIKYNNNNKKFETAGFVTSSGESTVDKVIMQTIQKALDMKLSTNMDYFKRIQGNPVLIIHL